MHNRVNHLGYMFEVMEYYTQPYVASPDLECLLQNTPTTEPYFLGYHLCIGVLSKKTGEGGGVWALTLSWRIQAIKNVRFP